MKDKEETNAMFFEGLLPDPRWAWARWRRNKADFLDQENPEEANREKLEQLISEYQALTKKINREYERLTAEFLKQEGDGWKNPNLPHYD